MTTSTRTKRRVTLLSLAAAAAVAAAIVALSLPGTAAAGTCDPDRVICGSHFVAVAGTTFTGEVGTSNARACGDVIRIDWGDGSPTTDVTAACSAVAFAPLIATHTYATQGTHTVMLADPRAAGPASATATVRPPLADLAIAMSGPDSVNGGSTLVYSITVSNARPDAARHVAMTDHLPYGMSFQSLTASGWTCNRPAAGAQGASVECYADPLANGERAATGIAVKVKALANRGAGVARDPGYVDDRAVVRRVRITASVTTYVTK